MKFGAWHWLQRLPAMLAVPRPEAAEYTHRIIGLQRNIILPARLLVVAIVLYHLNNSPWVITVVNTYGVMFETLQNVFAGYALVVLGATVLFYVVRRFPPGAVQWVVFAVGLGDGVFLGGLTVLTGGFESILYWVFPALMVLNAISIPVATPQIVLNLVLSIFFMGAGLLESNAQIELTVTSLRLQPLRHESGSRIAAEDISDPRAVAAWLKQSPPPVTSLVWEALSKRTREQISADAATKEAEAALRNSLSEDLNRVFNPKPNYVSLHAASPEPPETAAGPYVLRVTVLVLFTLCCYGVQVLAASQQRVAEEYQEFLVRTEQLRSAGRLAAEVAHQIKNPLAIINNAAFSLQRALKGGPNETAQPLRIIQEEVARADQIVTQIMGYAQLSEGRVEKLDVIEELNRAIEQVFPPGVPTEILVHREYSAGLPHLLMQRRHLDESVVNLLQNAREALAGKGNVFVSAICHPDDSVEISVRDDGPGVPPEKHERVFEAYYSTKERGTGLGLAMVKHNAELYSGTVRLESALGRGAKFVLLFPAKTLMKPGP